MSKFELDELPINNLYSESEETKTLRHKYYETENKLSIYKIIASIIIVLGLIILGIFLISTLIKINQKKDYSWALLYIGAIFLFLGIITEIIITQISNNLLNPIDEDIKRSIMNDQLELAGAKTNRKKFENLSISKTNNNIEITEQENKQNLKPSKELEERLENLAKKYNELVDQYEKLQEENHNLNNELNNLQKKNKKAELKSSTQKLNISIKKEKKKTTLEQIKKLKKLRLILIPIFMSLFVISFIFSLIYLISMSNITNLLISISCAGLLFFINILIFVLTTPTKEQNNKIK